MDKVIQLVPLRTQNSRLLIEDPKNSKILGPVIGYAQVPLVPLRQACASLSEIIPDILTYVSIAMRDTPMNPANGLTINESASIRLYTMEWGNKHASLYSILNHTLKTSDREELIPWFKYLKLFLTALMKIPCIPPQTVWRGVKKHVRDEFVRGTELTWWAFSSCTTTLPVLESDLYLGNRGERTLFSIEAINGRNIRPHSQYDDEDEILLLPGTSIEVKSQFNPAADLYVIHLKQKVPKQMLLEPPFEDACLYPKIERPWYRKKTFLIPLILFTIMSIAGIILGSIFGTRVRNSSGRLAITQSGSYYGGINGGVLFDDLQELSLTLPDDMLVAINASWSLDMLYDITFIYSNGKSAKHGGQYGYPASPPPQFSWFNLTTGETISRVTVYVDIRDIPNPFISNGTTLVVGLRFHTSQNRDSSLFGSSNGTKFDEMIDNYGVAYAMGRAEADLDGIQFMWFELI